jgi:hypothetical protein
MVGRPSHENGEKSGLVFELRERICGGGGQTGNWHEGTHTKYTKFKEHFYECAAYG